MSIYRARLRNTSNALDTAYSSRMFIMSVADKLVLTKMAASSVERC